MDNSLKFLARILISLPIAVFGFFHLTSASMIAGAVPSWLPGALFWVYFTGVVHITFAVFAIGNLKYTGYISLLVAGLLCFYALAIHLPGMIKAGKDQMASMAEMTGMLKDLSMAGGALYLSTVLKKN